MTSNLTPARITTPGKILNRELEARQWTKDNLAKMMGYSVETIVAILNGNQEITAEIANDLSQYLEIPAQVWINLEKNYRFYLANKASPIKF